MVLLISNEGTCKEIFFHSAKDWSKVVDLLSRALTEEKIRAERAPFQRWSWAKRFKHPVFCVVDPLTLGEDRLLLGWYLGKEGKNDLPRTLMPIVEHIRNINPTVEIIGFGSSGGGFAAIAATLLGCTDRAIAINPQTNALKFNVRDAVDSFQRKRRYTTCQSDLSKYGVSNLGPDSSILYVQNTFDTHHFTEHYLPFRRIYEQSSRRSAFSYIEYQDEKSGHMPPNLDQLCAIVGDGFTELLRD